MNVQETARQYISSLARNRDYTWSVFSSYVHMGMNILVQLVLIPIYLHYLSKEEFGLLMIILGGTNYLGIGIGWVAAGSQRIMGEHASHERTIELLSTYGLTKGLYLLYAIVTSAVIFAVLWFYLGGEVGFVDLFGPNALYIVVFGFANILVMYDLNADRVALIAVGKQAWAHVLSAVSLFVFACIVIPAMMYESSLSSVMGALFLGNVVARIMSFVVMRRNAIVMRLSTRQVVTDLKRLMGRMGGGYALYGILILTLLQGDTLLLAAMGGALIVSDYVLIWKGADVILQLLWRLPETLTPYLIHMDAKGERHRMQGIYKKANITMIGLSALCALLYALFGQAIVELWVGVEHTPQVSGAFALAGLGLFWMAIARLPVVYAFSTVRLQPLVAVLGFETIAKVIIVIALFPFVGLYAPLIAMSVIHVLGVAYLYQNLRRKVFS
ncbi:hypothetical protein V5T82_09020 [Magnetovibrio sp. PR-2]|uniref:lipopolysaccharide biosynthesis protein n=1 Tax=Magnetovibrio sp. PR-2 TaxID=3120356 RepID=UPI002FCE34AA